MPLFGQLYENAQGIMELFYGAAVAFQLLESIPWRIAKNKIWSLFSIYDPTYNLRNKIQL